MYDVLAWIWHNTASLAEDAGSCSGVELLQPSTALAGLALFALLYSALARMWSARRAPIKQILEKHPLPHEEEAQLQASLSGLQLQTRCQCSRSQLVHVHGLAISTSL